MGKTCYPSFKPATLLLALTLCSASETWAEASFKGSTQVHFSIHVHEVLSVQANPDHLELSSNNGDIFIANESAHTDSVVPLSGIANSQLPTDRGTLDGSVYTIATP